MISIIALFEESLSAKEAIKSKTEKHIKSRNHVYLLPTKSQLAKSLNDAYLGSVGWVLGCILCIKRKINAVYSCQSYFCFLNSWKNVLHSGTIWCIVI